LRVLGVSRIPEERFSPNVTMEEKDRLKRALLGPGELNWDSATQEEIDLLEYNERHIPEQARVNARYGVNSVSHVIPVPGFVTTQLESVISSGHEVVADFNLKWKWSQESQRFEWDPQAPEAWHIMVIVGYDRNRGVFILKNSWGTSDPRLAWVQVSYDYVTKAYGDGYFIDSVVPPPAPVQTEAAWLGEWVIPFEGRLLLRRFTDGDGCKRTGCWTKVGDYYRFDGVKQEVEGKIEGGRLLFELAPANQRIRPGSHGDSSFTADLFLGGDEPTVVFNSGFSKATTLDRYTRHGGPMAAQILAATAMQ
jgi:hypothetical protein